MLNTFHHYRVADRAKRYRRSAFTILEMIVMIVVIICILGVLVALLLPATRRAGPAARRSACQNNLKQIGLALHNYHDKYGAFPPPYTVDADGQPLHSWRTLILPFVDQAPVYKKIDLSKPWDDPANAEAYSSEVYIYRCPSADIPPQQTTYLALISAKSFFQENQSRVLDGPANENAETVMVIEVAPEHAVHWMEPNDANRRTGFGFGPETEFAHREGTHALFVDGHVQFVPDDTNAEDRHKMIVFEKNE